jgi:hypothetical protein
MIGPMMNDSPKKRRGRCIAMVKVIILMTLLATYFVVAIEYMTTVSEYLITLVA